MTRQIRISRAALLLVLVCLLGPQPALGQVTTAVVQGRVLDVSDAGMPGAIITARHTGTGAVRTTTADSDGRYRLAALAVGVYDISAEMAGFTAQVRPAIVLRVGQEAAIDFTLTVAQLKETVTVQAEAPIVEPTKSALGGTITRQQIDDLPVAERNFTNLAYLVPGILNSVNSESSDVTIGSNGANGTGNTFLVDGLSNDQNAVSSSRGFFSLDAIAEYQVLTNQYAAEYGQATGAIINVVTRSGANGLRGRGFAYYRADDLSANDPFVPPDRVTGVREKAPFSQNIFGGYLAGPIRKDRTFYFASYDHTLRDETSVVSVSPQLLEAHGLDTQTNFPNPTRRPLILAKVDHQFSGNQTFTARYRLDDRTEENDTVGGVNTGQTAVDASAVNQDFALLDTWVISPRVLNEARFQFARQDNDLTGVACPGCPFIQRPSFNSGKAANRPQAFLEDRVQIMDAVSVTTGGHSLKGGIDLSLIDLTGFVPQNFDGLFLFSTDAPFDPRNAATYPLLYQKSDGNPSFDINNSIAALFVQDQWRAAPNLTFNLGLRWDYESHRATSDDRNNFGPRLHFAWDPVGDGKTSIRGGYGRYYDQVFLNVVLFTVLLDGSITTTRLVSPGYPDPFVGGAGLSVPVPPPTVFRFQPDLKTPYSDTFSVGAHREIAPDLAVSADWVRARGRDLLALIDTNYSVGGAPRPNPGFSQVYEIQSVGEMDYDALQVGAQKRLSHRYTFGLAYTLSENNRNTDGHQFTPVDARDLDAEYAPTDNDARHSWAGSVNYDAPWAISVGLSGRYRSALPYDTQTGRDDNRDANVNDRPPGVSRNSGRGVSAWTLDARIAKALRFGRSEVELIAEAFNLTNHVSRGSFTENMQSPNFGLPTRLAAGFPMRQVQVGVRVEF